jgi:orotate phosphoribosyltransferase
MSTEILASHEVEAALKESGALLEGHFLLASGRHSQFYVEKFRLLEQPRLTSRLCAEIARRFQDDNIECVIGPVTGGIILAFEVARLLGTRAVYAERAENGADFTLRRGFQLKAGEKCLVVEDIVTTGGSAQKVVELVRANGGEVVGCALLVDRSNGALQIDAPRIESLLEMKVESWAPGQEPDWLAEKYGPVRKPGTTRG